MKTPKQKIQIIDFVRSVSILMVLALHLRDHCCPPAVAWLKDLWVAIVVKGYYGVSLFFVISGFLISKLIDEDLGGLHHPDLRKFYIRRIARILPLLIVIIGFGLVMHTLLLNSTNNSKFIFMSSRSPLNWVFLVYPFHIYIQLDAGEQAIGGEWIRRPLGCPVVAFY